MQSLFCGHGIMNKEYLIKLFLFFVALLGFQTFFIVAVLHRMAVQSDKNEIIHSIHNHTDLHLQ